MSEETPTFKVTDRRMFNPDGTVREDYEPSSTSSTTSSPTAVSSSGAGDSPSSTFTAVSPETTANTTATTNAANASNKADKANQTDPLFMEAVMIIAQQAAAMMSGHPQFGGEVSLPEAKIFIDMLGAIRKKAAGNLSAEEQGAIENLLSQLRMQFVQLQQQTAASPVAPKGFTGSDITGGK